MDLTEESGCSKIGGSVPSLFGISADFTAVELPTSHFQFAHTQLLSRKLYLINAWFLESDLYCQVLTANRRHGQIQ